MATFKGMKGKVEKHRHLNQGDNEAIIRDVFVRRGYPAERQARQQARRRAV